MGVDTPVAKLPLEDGQCLVSDVAGDTVGPNRIVQSLEEFGVPYGSRTRVAAVKEK